MKLILFPRSFKLKPIALITYYGCLMLISVLFRSVTMLLLDEAVKDPFSLSQITTSLVSLFIGASTALLLITYLLDLNLAAQWVSTKRYDYWGSIILLVSLGLSLTGIVWSYFTPGQFLLMLSSTWLFIFTMSSVSNGIPHNIFLANSIVFLVIYLLLLIATLLSAKRSKKSIVNKTSSMS